jgi:hypothetical protein
VVLYARSDVVGVGVPNDGGGCGQFHSRPVIEGKPVKLFAIDCPLCEDYLTRRLPDQWTPDRWRIPLTPDEAAQVETLERQAKAMQERESQTRARLLAAELAAQASEVRRDTPEDEVILVRPTAQRPVSPPPPEPVAPVSPPPVVKSSEQLAAEDAATNLGKLTVAQLKVLCREAGLPATGNRAALVKRLEDQG